MYHQQSCAVVYLAVTSVCFIVVNDNQCCLIVLNTCTVLHILITENFENLSQKFNCNLIS